MDVQNEGGTKQDELSWAAQCMLKVLGTLLIAMVWQWYSVRHAHVNGGTGRSLQTSSTGRICEAQEKYETSHAEPQGRQSDDDTEEKGTRSADKEGRSKSRLLDAKLEQETTAPVTSVSSEATKHNEEGCKNAQKTIPPLTQISSNNNTSKPKRPKRAVPPPRHTPVTSPPPPPPFLSSTNTHPGLEAFWNWCDIEASLFRIYTIGRTDGSLVAPPYHPSSRRGKVSIHLQVENKTSEKIAVYWVNYKGKEVFKGAIRPRGSWSQTTWIDHPWVFRRFHPSSTTTPENLFHDNDNDNDVQGQLLCHYIPCRVIPTSPFQATTHPDDPATGIHTFSILSPSSLDIDQGWACRIQDPIFPYPAKTHVTTPTQAMDGSLHHCLRMSFPSWDLLHTYIQNMLQHPKESKYRQIRMANKTFYNQIWNIPAAKGVLLAAGFVEHGAYVEVGCEKALDGERLKELSWLLHGIERWRQVARVWENGEGTGGHQSQQPVGADGFGRAGFGRAGAMS